MPRPCWLLALAFLLPSPPTEAASVRLIRWDGKAAALPLFGPGEQQLRLRADVRWSADAGRDPAQYEVRVTLPDGSVVTRSIAPREAPGSRRLSVAVPASSVRDLPPDRVRLLAAVYDRATGAPISNVLAADIGDFPTPATGAKAVDNGPFGWGRPLAPQAGAAPLPRPGPSDLLFVRVVPSAGQPGYFLASTEVSVGQVKQLLPDYDPRAGRSDEFELERVDQPAINLSAERARAYLDALSKSDHSGLVYRLPTEAEWLHAARAGRPTAFWWGDEPSYPAGANFLGPEPALEVDSTAPTRPRRSGEGFAPNPWGLYHTFGNAAEWALGTSGVVRLGGHFRTEPTVPLPPEPVDDPSTTGPDAYVSVRPAFDLSAERGTELVRAALKDEPMLSWIVAAFDPDRATVTLTGEVADPSARRAADRRLASLWFVAAVDNRLSTPAAPAGALAQLGRVVRRRRIAPLGHVMDELTVEVRWADPLPVAGSAWYVNVFGGDGGQFSHRLVSPPDATGVLQVLVDTSRIAPGIPITVALSLGAPATTPADTRIVSNMAVVAPAPR